MLHKALDAFPRRPARRLAACRLRQSARQRFGSRSVAKCPLTRQRFSLRPPRETSRHDKSGCGTPGCRPVTPPGAPAPRGSRSCRCSGRHADHSATAQVHRSGASPGRAICAAWTVSITRGSSSPPRLLRALRCRAIYPRHHGVTTKICLAARAPTGLKAAFRPRHYRISRMGIVPLGVPVTSWGQPGSDGALPISQGSSHALSEAAYTTQLS